MLGLDCIFEIFTLVEGLVTLATAEEDMPQPPAHEGPYTVVTLLHCCYTVVTLLLHCCYTVVALLLHYTVVALL
jgi:hypothetical protein